MLKATLSDHKSIWRRIAIRSDQTLDDLHAAIFQAFDRFDEHLDSFHTQPMHTRRGPDFGRGDVECTSPIMIEEADPFGEADVRDASKTTVAALNLQAGEELYYIFDFGDSWWHDLAVEQVDQPLEKGRRHPSVMEKRGASPPHFAHPDQLRLTPRHPQLPQRAVHTPSPLWTICEPSV